MDPRDSTAKDRRRFRVALTVFFVWVAALAAMAVVSGRRPEARPPAAGAP